MRYEIKVWKGETYWEWKVKFISGPTEPVIIAEYRADNEKMAREKAVAAAKAHYRARTATWEPIEV